MKIQKLASLSIAVLLGCTALSAETGSAPTPPPPNAGRPAPAIPNDKLTASLRELTGKIQAKLQAATDRPTEESLAPELAQFDKIIADNKDAQPDELAQVLLMKASLYLQVFEDTDKGAEIIKRIKTDYPTSTFASKADDFLQRIEAMKVAKSANDKLNVGNPFPDFSATDTNGKAISLAQFKGKVVLVDFWATWCGPCVEEIPHVKAAYEKYHSKGFEIVGISLDREESKLTTYIQKNGMPWAQIFDNKSGDAGLANKFGIEAIPATFLIGPDGKIIARDMRGDDLENELAKALK